MCCIGASAGPLRRTVPHRIGPAPHGPGRAGRVRVGGPSRTSARRALSASARPAGRGPRAATVRAVAALAAPYRAACSLWGTGMARDR